MKKIKILIVEDHNLIIDGITAMLNSYNEFIVVGNAINGSEAIEKYEMLKPDVVIMDISMPVISGFEATRIIVEKYPNAKIIALTQHDDSEYILQFLQIGGMGYLLKNAKKDEFIEAIKTIYDGKKYLTNDVSNLMVNSYLLSSKKNESIENQERVPLTKREIEIIKLIALDLNNREIAIKLNISQRTVETHRRNLMQKLNIKTVVALVKYAIQYKIIEIE